MATGTYTAERDYLLSHPELLTSAADAAVTEALLDVSEDEASRYSGLRDAARQDGAEAAYEPLLLTILAYEFARADPGQQQSLLAARSEDLLTGTVASVLRDAAEHGGDDAGAAQRAAAVLSLAGSGDVAAVFDALGMPERFPGLLHAFAARDDPAQLAPAAVAAATSATAPDQMAAALLYLAIAEMISGGADRAHGLLGQARQLSPEQASTWINELASIGQHHPAVLTLIPVLTAQADQDPPGSQRSAGDAVMTPADMVVVLPGILGSTLARDGHLIWAPSAGSALRAIATFGASVKRLQLPDGIGDDHPGDGVEPAGLMPDLHILPGIWTPVKGYDRLLDRLRSLGYREPTPATPGNLLPFPYDWRLSCRYNARRLGEITEPALDRWRAQGPRYSRLHSWCSCATPWAA